ncbi:unnamed protein product [Meganyctiphanes norvegica]|uniref:Uncharacterized protein n=1 Tax=Meganyctiphanes norvegica TaxID=48144 RepID=A0AAV2RLJ4_MEGNR
MSGTMIVTSGLLVLQLVITSATPTFTNTDGDDQTRDPVPQIVVAGIFNPASRCRPEVTYDEKCEICAECAEPDCWRFNSETCQCHKQLRCKGKTNATLDTTTATPHSTHQHNPVTSSSADTIPDVTPDAKSCSPGVLFVERCEKCEGQQILIIGYFAMIYLSQKFMAYFLFSV